MKRIKSFNQLRGLLVEIATQEAQPIVPKKLKIRCSIPLIARKTSSLYMTLDEVDIVMRTAHPPIYKKRGAHVVMGRRA